MPVRESGLPGSPAPNADVMVADAMALPYRHGSCDALLCIAVLHHISSVPRRLRLLRQLLLALRPGGRALVTVWATEQEDPKKTVAKWTRIDVAAASEAQQSAASSGACSTSSADGAAEQPGVRGGAEEGSASGPQSGSSAPDRSASGGIDYFVPWHVPFHRTEAAAAVRLTRQEQQTAAASSSGRDVDHVGSRSSQHPSEKGVDRTPTAAAGAAVAAGAGPRVDTSKGAVVFQRYYHLFGPGELEGLVEQLADEGAVVVDSFYDRSNWCVIFERRMRQ